MSEDINLWVIGPAMATVQFGMAIRDLWRSWAARNRKPEPTDYERVVYKGETIKGWRLAIPAMAGLNKDTNEMIIYSPVDPFFIDPEGKECPATISDPTVTLHFKHPWKSDWKLHSIRQYNVFDATEKILLNMRYQPSKMKPVFSAFVTPTMILTAFRMSSQNEATDVWFYMFLFDTRKPNWRSFKVLAPSENVFCAYVTDRPKPLLHVVFYVESRNDDDVAIIEFMDCRFDAPTEIGVPRMWMCDSIVIPVGNRSAYVWLNVGSAAVFVVSDDAEVENADAHICITLDRTRTWRKQTLAEWLESFRSSSDGAIIMQAIETLGALPPPAEWSSFDIPALRYFYRVSVHANGRCVLGVTDCEGLLRRWIAPPTLKQTAIEAFVKSNPGLEMETMKTLLGAALFEAMFGEESKVRIEATLETAENV